MIWNLSTCWFLCCSVCASSSLGCFLVQLFVFISPQNQLVYPLVQVQLHISSKSGEGVMFFLIHILTHTQILLLVPILVLQVVTHLLLRLSTSSLLVGSNILSIGSCSDSSSYDHFVHYLVLFLFLHVMTLLLVCLLVHLQVCMFLHKLVEVHLCF